ncbi:TonB-dependent receptor [Pedobacter gandavensis]|uniref:TonB-dependent receptor plug domain-containing protein n=1 Tax=Pedobacter gandavensis TaxID=2679963 RepID=A0ABR6F0J2_9SPHI|nr:TonB-dependent receptor [Pedobacter gandavensis]MBB2151058.1 TonB-dependent receptor plug domain-containing protein [Pedobacter gandavensis]
MHRKFLYPLLGLTIALFAFSSGLFNDPFDLIMSRMETFNKKYAQEKVHLHLDKPYYAVGDSIWFKAYLFNTATQEPSEISKLLYVELINEKNGLEQQLKLPVRAGVTWGNFSLPDSLIEGNYRIRAYTQWMRNAGPDFFFDKTIKIGSSWNNSVFTNTAYTFSKENTAEKIKAELTFRDKDGNPYKGTDVRYEVQLDAKSILKDKASTNEQGEISFSFLNNSPELNAQTKLLKKGKIIATITLPNKRKVTKVIPIQATSTDVDVQFLPESGNLVEGIPNKIGIKAVNNSGLGEQISGDIIDQDGSVINHFETKHLGMGNVIITPEPGVKYTARLKFADGSKQQVPLPAAQPSGYVMSVTNIDKEKLVVKIMRSADLKGSAKIKVVGHQGGNILFSPTVNMNGQMESLSISKKELTEGILHLSLFTEENKPIAERLVFIYNPGDRVTAKLKGDKATYGKKEQVTFNLNTLFEGKPIAGTFSVAVTNTNAITPDPENESNIFSNLLLTSDLTGYVEKPNYYFNNEGPEVIENMDNLMLTQGWSRILWKDVILNNPPAIKFQPEESLAISGVVTDYSGKPSVNSKVTVIAANGSMSLDTLTDQQGKFNIDNIYFLDTKTFTVTARTDKGKKRLNIKMDVVPGQVVTKSKNTGDIEVNVNEALSAYLKQSTPRFNQLNKLGFLQKTTFLDEVEIKDQKKPVVRNSSNLNGNGRADIIITAEQILNCSWLTSCIQARVPGVMVKNGKFYLMRFGGKIPMAVIHNGMQLPDNDISMINKEDVQTIEVLNSLATTGIYGSGAAGGVLIITTKIRAGNFSDVAAAPGLIKHTADGYSMPQLFYAPVYEPDQANNPPDSRSTVYWDSQVFSNGQGETAFSFYNTNEPGTYRVVLEGMDLAGHLARTVYTYEVK